MSLHGCPVIVAIVRDDRAFLSKKGGQRMAELKTSTRNKLPASKFALPGRRAYPITDRAHAQNAKARATQMVSKGKLSPASAAKIRKKADRLLGKGED
jgi:hypothetical protein